MRNLEVSKVGRVSKINISIQIFINVKKLMMLNRM